MIEAVLEVLQTLLAIDADAGDIGVIPMALRTVLIFGFTLLLLRLGSSRFLSRATAFDVIVAIMLGSIMSRGINGSADLLPTMAGGAVLVAMHWLFALLAFHTDWFGKLVKGERILLIKDGNIQWDGMQQGNLSRRDLEETLRMQGSEPDPSKIQLAYLERNGRISAVPAEKEPRIFTVAVKDGVQTVRIELK